MRNLALLTALATALFLAACDKKECTKDSLDQTTTDLMVKVREFGLANPDKMAEIGPRVADLVARSQTATGDLQPLCDAIDALMSEIGG